MSTAVMVEYRELLADIAPRAIHTEAENERAIGKLEELSSKENPSVPERQLIELLAVLIEDFEEKHYQLKPARPVEVLVALMEAHGLRQKDLVDVFRTPSIVSEVLSEKRSLTTNHIKKLAQKFHTSPAVFI